MADLADLRREYGRRGLSEADVAPDPVAQLGRWLDEAVAAKCLEPNALTVATVAPDGRPRARVVLLKGLDARGLVFYTNAESAKGQELAANPDVALVLHWPELERQVRATGRAAPVPAEEADAYFASRPLGSRLGAWASPQSEVVPDRAALEARLAEATARFPDGEVPRPPHWGGYRVTPETVEFWQGRPNRRHDRLRYRRAEGAWLRERLAP